MKRSDADEERFKKTIDSVALLASLSPPIADLDFALRELEKADAFGTILDPTAWRKSLRDREAITPFVKSARQFVAAGEAFQRARTEIMAQRESGTDIDHP